MSFWKKPTRPLRAAFDAADAPDADVAALLKEIGDHTITTRDESAKLARLIRRWLDAGAPESSERTIGSTFHDVLALMQSMPSREVAAPIVELLPAIVRLYEARADAWLAAPKTEKKTFDFHDGGDLVFALKVLAMYRETDPIVRAIDRGVAPDEYLWSIVAHHLAQSGDGVVVLASLGGRIPDGFVGVALLDLANTLAREGKIARHPFDTTAGHARLHGWLTGNETSYAHSATATLPFVREDVRAELLAIADAYADLGVQMEAAWVRARAGDEAGVKRLATWAADPRHHARAAAYLNELGRADALSPETQTPNFRAVAEMAEWLAHPNEFGRPPQAIELFDHRMIDWPPTHDRRPVWLVRYRYDDGSEGIGMVGSMTFALFGEATAELSAEDVYGLHCCWELEMNQDPRAPKERSVAAGKKILGFE